MTEEKNAFEKMKEAFSAENYGKWLSAYEIDKNAAHVGIDFTQNVPKEVKDIIDNFDKNKSHD